MTAFLYQRSSISEAGSEPGRWEAGTGPIELHQKVFTIDHQWCSIGSTNFDDRSFEINDEVSLVIFDENIARELEDTFEKDLASAKEAHLGEWKKRPVVHKLKDFAAFLLNEQL